MRYHYSVVSSLALAGSTLAAYVPSEPWSTLTPSATVSGGATDYSGTFGIAVVPITTGSLASSASSESSVEASSSSAAAAASGAHKRDVASQIGDGQVQATTATAQAISQINDGQIQASTSTAAPKSTAQPVSQIGDGQIQATTATAQAISQIGDGQIQASTATPPPPTSTVQPISQIGDGQIQATHSTAQAISQITDGQIQASTATTSAASQITDGQVQASSIAVNPSASTATNGTATDATSSAEAAAATAGVNTVACKVDGTLQLTLEKSILKDSNGRIGSIVANRQFQFDGPPPQAGAIYAAGWSISDGNLAIGETVVFYQCLSGTFYNLYDQTLGPHCKPVHLEVTGLINC